MVPKLLLYNKQINSNIKVESCTIRYDLDSKRYDVPLWQLQQSQPDSILVCGIPKQLKFDNVSNLNFVKALSHPVRPYHPTVVTWR